MAKQLVGAQENSAEHGQDMSIVDLVRGTANLHASTANGLNTTSRGTTGEVVARGLRHTARADRLGL